MSVMKEMGENDDEPFARWCKSNGGPRALSP